VSDVLPWGEWRPDVSAYKGSHSPTITNVVPRGDGYGPWKSYAALSDALAAACRGFFTAYDDDGTVAIFAGTAAAELYKMSNTDYSWETVSAATYTALSSTDQWQYTQFGTRVIAVQGNDNPQSYVMGSSTDFADLGGTPPNAKYVTTVGEFVVLSGLTSDPFTIQWSSRSDPTEWTIGTNEGDSQTFQDGGLVRGIAGGEFGLVFQDTVIRRMTYQPGSDVIFSFDKISEDLGLWAPYSIIKARDFVFFLSPTGFYSWHPLQGFKAIGKERVDRTFFNDVDQNSKQLIIGVNDPTGSRVMWVYKSSQGSDGLFDRAVVYDYALDRWAGFINISGEYIATAAIPGVTLENLDNVNSSVDALTVSFDDYATGFQQQIALANSSHMVGLFTGSNMEATLETADIVNDTRVFVRAVRPVTDAGTVYGSVANKQKVSDTADWGSESEMNAVGFCPHRVDTRIARFRNRIPAGTTWSFTMGVEPVLVGTGER
jgi:hypothetical protein